MLKIGHRGAPGYPRSGENTFSSFKKALRAGARAIKLDVRRTRDGKLVVMQDRTIDRTTNGNGYVRDLTYKDLEQFNAGYGEYAPLLECVLNHFGTHCLLLIELREQGLVRDAEQLILDYDLSASVIVSAFDEDDNAYSDSSWEELLKFSSQVPTALLATSEKIRRLGEKEYIKKAMWYGVSAIKPAKAATTPSLIQRAHQAGLRVYTWTVNSPRKIAHLKRMGVDGIISDFPERL